MVVVAGDPAYGVGFGEVGDELVGEFCAVGGVGVIAGHGDEVWFFAVEVGFDVGEAVAAVGPFEVEVAEVTDFVGFGVVVPVEGFLADVEGHGLVSARKRMMRQVVARSQFQGFGKAVEGRWLVLHAAMEAAMAMVRMSQGSKEPSVSWKNWASSMRRAMVGGSQARRSCQEPMWREQSSVRREEPRIQNPAGMRQVSASGRGRRWRV